MPDSLKTLTETFRRLGAPEPEQWAKSQLEERIPQLERFLFLKHAWEGVVADGSEEWIQQAIHAAESDPNGPYSGLGLALSRMLALGASSTDLTEMARALQAMTLFHVCAVIDGAADLSASEEQDVSWALVGVDSEGNMTSCIDALHESVLETDPTGREIRPRGTAI